MLFSLSLLSYNFIDTVAKTSVLLNYFYIGVSLTINVQYVNIETYRCAVRRKANLEDAGEEKPISPEKK